MLDLNLMIPHWSSSFETNKLGIAVFLLPRFRHPKTCETWAREVGSIAYSRWCKVHPLPENIHRCSNIGVILRIWASHIVKPADKMLHRNLRGLRSDYKTSDSIMWYFSLSRLWCKWKNPGGNLCTAITHNLPQMAVQMWSRETLSTTIHPDSRSSNLFPILIEPLLVLNIQTACIWMKPETWS